MNEERIEQIIDSNDSILKEFFIGMASGNYSDGTCWRLYADLWDDTLVIDQQISDQSWIQRDDDSLRCIYTFRDVPNPDHEENYEPYTEGCDLNDYGWLYWLDEVREALEERCGENA